MRAITRHGGLEDTLEDIGPVVKSPAIDRAGNLGEGVEHESHHNPIIVFWVIQTEVRGMEVTSCA